MKGIKKIILSAMAVVCCLLSCGKTDNTTPSTPTTNGTGTLVLDGKSYAKKCVADKSGGMDGCGKISVSLYQSGDDPYIVFYHFPEDASGVFSLGDGNSQRACNQIYAYVSPGGWVSKNITLKKTGAKSFTFSGTVYDPVSNIAQTVSGDGYFTN